MRQMCLGLALAAGLAACSGGRAVEFQDPPARAFVADGDATWVRVRADDADAVLLSVDGGDPLPMMRDEDGKFLATLALPAGRHELLATVPGVAGAVDTRTVFVGRVAAAPIDGYDVSRGGSHVLVLADGRPGPGGLYEGELSVHALTTGGAPFEVGRSRLLTKRGVYGEATDQGRVVWVDEWRGERGLLHLAAIDGGEELARAGDVRDFKFARDGLTLGVLDDGVMVMGADSAAEAFRITNHARAFVFAGAEPDVVTFDGDTDSNARHVTLASAPLYQPIALAPQVLPIIGSTPLHREAFFFEYVESGYGDLLRYDFEALEVDRPFHDVSGIAFSRDGGSLLALVDTLDGEASAGVLRLDDPDAEPLVIEGALSSAAFDASGSRVYGLVETFQQTHGHPISRLVMADLADAEPAFVEVADRIDDFLALPEDRMLLLTSGESLAILESDGTYLELGKWNPEQRQVSLSLDGATFAFTAVDEATGATPIRRVNLLTGAMADLGTDGARPIALDGGAVAWAESKGEGLDGRDLWILPAFPAAVNGPFPLATDVSTTHPFAVSPDGVRFAVLADERVWCGDAGGHLAAIGDADARRREMFFLADGRLGRFGRDGSEERILFFQRCP